VVNTLLLFGIFSLHAAPEDIAGIEFFEKKIRPVFAEHCFACHSAKSKSVKGGLRLDSREFILKGGDSGKILVPKKPAESLLLRALQHEEAVKGMPPKEKLPAQLIADIEEWITRGAPIPATVAKAGTDLATLAKNQRSQISSSCSRKRTNLPTGAPCH
jgi:Planctomycete cytochrome C